MKTSLQTIASKLDNFDHFYMMSDDPRVYDKYGAKESQIKEELADLSPEELHEVFEAVTVSTDWIERHFSAELARAEAPKSFRSDVFRTAWAFLREGLFNSFSEALRAAWRRFRLVRRLRSGIAYFDYEKANGEIRKAIGTLAGNNFNYTPKGQSGYEKAHVLKYWDVEKRAFRACRIDRLISIQ